MFHRHEARGGNNRHIAHQTGKAAFHVDGHLNIVLALAAGPLPELCDLDLLNKQQRTQFINRPILSGCQSIAESQAAAVQMWMLLPAAGPELSTNMACRPAVAHRCAVGNLLVVLQEDALPDDLCHKKALALL